MPACEDDPTEQQWVDAAEREGLRLLDSLPLDDQDSILIIGARAFPADLSRCFITWLALTDDEKNVTGKAKACFTPEKAVKARILVSYRYPKAHDPDCDPARDIPTLHALVGQ